MPIEKIPFPKITIINKVLGNAKEAIANQQKLREEATNNDEEPKVYNLQWRKKETIIRDRKVLKIVTLTADVINIPDGQPASIKIFIPSNDEYAEKQVVELTGIVKNKRVTIEWELEDSIVSNNNNN